MSGRRLRLVVRRPSGLHKQRLLGWKMSMKTVVPSVGEMLDSGAASLDKIEFHGPKAGWPTFKKSADALGAIYWDRYASFSKFKM